RVRAGLHPPDRRCRHDLVRRTRPARQSHALYRRLRALELRDGTPDAKFGPSRIAVSSPIHGEEIASECRARSAVLESGAAHSLALSDRGRGKRSGTPASPLPLRERVARCELASNEPGEGCFRHVSALTRLADFVRSRRGDRGSAYAARAAEG